MASVDRSIPFAVKERADAAKASTVTKATASNAVSEFLTYAHPSEIRRSTPNKNELSCMIAEENESNVSPLDPVLPVNENEPAVKLN